MRLKTAPSFGSLNYLSRVESLHTPLLSSDESQGSIARHANALMLIGAPEDFDQVPENNYLTLLFDNYGQKRNLPIGAYQITPTAPMDDLALGCWAEKASRMLMQPFTRPGLVGLDLADLRTVLQACSSRRLVLQVIEYGHENSLPLDSLRRWRFRNLFACLYGGADVGLDRYAELGGALEQLNPGLNQLRLGVCSQQHGKMRILLVSELG